MPIYIRGVYYCALYMIQTKIIANIGPQTESAEMLTGLIRAGASILRMNFSHCGHDEYRTRASRIRRISKTLGKPIRILQDLQGPRVRVGTLPSEGVTLTEGATYLFCHKGKLHRSAIPISDPYLHVDIKKGDALYLANGELELRVTKTANGCIYATVLRGGILFSNKAINVPDTTLRGGGLTRKDIADVRFALKTGVDMIALSFVQSATDVLKLRKLIGSKKNIQIVSKIERGVALKHIDEIIQVSDAIMIARGDLGIEVPMEDLPIIQKNLIRHAHWHNTPAIVATQILTSMINHPHPTRAEVSDIANAVLDGADALMLSDETTVGKHPVQAVHVLHKVITRTERYMHAENFFSR